MSITQTINPYPKVAAPVTQAVQNAAARTGEDFGYLMDVARVESGYDSNAKAATSSARGLFQFTSQTWLSTLDKHGASHGLAWAAEAINRDDRGRFSVPDAGLRDQILALRNNPAISSAMAASLTADNRAYMEPRIGRSAEPVDLYLAHFLGSAGAVNFLSAMSADPSQPGAALLPDAAASNQSIFYGAGGRMRSLSEIRDMFSAKLDSESQDFSSPYPIPTPSERRLAPTGWEVASSIQSSANSGAGRPPLPMMDIQPMPKKLSMGFAADAYRRLAALSGNEA